jgi:quinol monooxygenase YgiN
MLIRLVRMTFRPAARDDFLAIFEEAAPEIRAFAGCEHLALWQGARYDHIFTTHSRWKGEDALERFGNDTGNG